MTTVNQAKAAQLRADAATILREAERLDREAAAETALKRELRRPVMPAKRDASEAAYLVFQRELSGKQYSYAAVLFGSGDNSVVVHTGRPDSGARRRPYTWDDFLSFVGENNWHTLQVMTVAAPLLTKSGATVNDLGAMADAVVNGCPEVVEPYHGKAGPVTPFGTGYGQY